MGFEPEAVHYRLKFADPGMAGLEVTAESLSVDDFLTVSALAATAQEAGAAGAAKSAEDLLDAFAENLVSWNVTRKGHKVPADRAGIGGQKFDFVLKIVMAWMEAIASVDNPLPEGLSSGGTSPEASIPMEPLSQNHESSLVPS